MTPRRFPPPWTVETRSGPCAKTFTPGSFVKYENPAGESGQGREATRRSPLFIVLVTAMLVTFGTLAVMNNACKSNQHAWCAPTSMRHPIKLAEFN